MKKIITKKLGKKTLLSETIVEQSTTLSEREETLSIALDLIGGGTYDWSPKTGKFNWDSRMQEIYGYPKDSTEDPFEFYFSALHPDDVEKSRALYLKMMDSRCKENRLDSVRRIIKNGNVHYIKGSNVLFRNEKGEVERIIGTSQDITEKKNKELLLLATKERLNEAQRIGKVGSFETELEGRKIWWSKGMYDIFEISPDQDPPDGIDFLAIVHPDDREYILQKTKTGIKEQKRIELEYRLLFPDGRIKYMNDVATPIANNEGWVIKINGMSKDVTESKLAEIALKKSEERLQISTKAAKVGIWDLDLENDLLIWDETMLSLYGLPSDKKLINIELWLTLLHPDDRENTLKEIEKVIKHGTEFNMEFRIIRPDQDIRYMKTFGDVHRDEDGKTVRLFGVNWDFTKEKEAEQQEIRSRQLSVRNEELEQFAYVASHDLKEPLRTIKSFSEIIKGRYADRLDDSARKYLGFISQAASRMDNVIKALLDYSRIGRESELKTVNCNHIVHSVLRDLSALIKEADACFGFDTLPVVNGYQTELRMLFQNLISNAIKFRDEKRKLFIQISAAKKSNYWEFCIEDNGIGIDSDYHEKIFAIFQRLHANDEFEGTGIGLAHCKKIIDLHNGKIWVESTPDKGSKFYFTIPL